MKYLPQEIASLVDAAINVAYSNNQFKLYKGRISHLKTRPAIIDDDLFNALKMEFYGKTMSLFQAELYRFFFKKKDEEFLKTLNTTNEERFLFRRTIRGNIAHLNDTESVSRDLYEIMQKGDLNKRIASDIPLIVRYISFLAREENVGDIITLNDVLYIINKE
jgi:hypothetical protein